MVYALQKYMSYFAMNLFSSVFQNIFQVSILCWCLSSLRLLLLLVLYCHLLTYFFGGTLIFEKKNNWYLWNSPIFHHFNSFSLSSSFHLSRSFPVCVKSRIIESSLLKFFSLCKSWGFFSHCCSAFHTAEFYGIISKLSLHLTLLKLSFGLPL